MNTFSRMMGYKNCCHNFLKGITSQITAKSLSPFLSLNKVNDMK